MAELPRLKSLVERHRDQPFALIGLDVLDEKEEFRRKCEEFGVTWRNGYQGKEAKISLAWGITMYPTLFVLDAEGVIRYRDVHGDELDKAVETLLAELESSPR